MLMCGYGMLRNLSGKLLTCLLGFLHGISFIVFCGIVVVQA